MSSERVGKVLYGSLFVVAWPAALARWAWGLDRQEWVTWPVPVPATAGATVVLLGVALMCAAMIALWVHGGGLPMNAFPPKRRVERSVYRLFAHPIYVGFSIAAFAVAAAAGSPSGFWVVAPITVLAAVALVLGYEGPDVLARFGPRRTRPLLALAPDDDGAASRVTRAVAVVLAWGTWAVVYALLSRMPAPEAARELRFAFEIARPRPAWWIWPYSLAYPFVALCPLVLATNREVRQFVLAVWIGSAVGFAAMLLWPAKAEWLVPTSGGGLMLALNRGLDADWLACPSFHVAWSFLAAHVYARRWPQLRVPAYALAVIIAVSSVASGAHAAIDAVAGLALAGIAVRHDAILHALVRHGEAIANSWHAWRIGPLRVISHAGWTATAAFAGTLGAAMLAGQGAALEIGLVGAGGLIGALAFGCLVEGRHFARPFGYFGFLFGGLAVLAVLATASSLPDTARIAAALAAVAPLTQAIGRGRCLVQGCCHGHAGFGDLAIRVWHPMSRTSCIPHLAGIPVWPTQLISAGANVAISAVLLRLWATGAPAAFICGLYLVLIGLVRFAEEGLRGEPQTPVWRGLSIYQWLSVLIFLGGAVVTALPSERVILAPHLETAAAWVALVAAVVAATAMSVDWPETQWPMSRLSAPDRMTAP
jgi:hypothetical protein